MDEWSRNLRQFHMCIFCSLKVCDKLLWPREIVDNRCPACESRDWYPGPVYQNIEEINCRVHFCNSCRHILCSCTIDSLLGQCPWCSVFDKWVALPPGMFEDLTKPNVSSENFTAGGGLREW